MQTPETMNTKMQMVTFRLEKDLYDFVKQQSRDQKRSMSNYIQKLIYDAKTDFDNRNELFFAD